MSYCMITTTFSSEAEAIKLAKLIIEEKLAACCQVIPKIKSIYMWKGEIQKSEEVILTIKSREYLGERIEKLIKEKHSYKVPEIIKIKIDDGSIDYLNWIDCCTDKNRKNC